MHFTSVQQLNLSHYLYKSLIKLTEKVQRMGENHHTSIFHHGFVKVLVCHQLAQVNFSWEDFSNSTFPPSSLAISRDESTPPNSLV